MGGLVTDWLAENANASSVALFALLIGMYALLLRGRNKSRNLPPGPRGWPIVGNLLSLNLHSERVMAKWNKEYGPVCRLKMASREFIILGTMEAVEEAFVKKGEIFSDRLQNSIPGMSGTTGILCRNFDNELREQRRFGHATLKFFGMGRRSIEPCILENCSEIILEIESHCEKGEAFSIEFMVYQTISSIISQLVFGKNLAKENKEFRGVLHETVTGSKYSDFNGLTVFYPGLKVIPPFSWGLEATMEYEANLARVIQEQVNEHKKTRDPNDARDFIDCFLNEIDASNENNTEARGFYDEQLNYSVRDLLLAGTDTTSGTICWAMLYLSRNQDIQAKLQHEIDEVLGTTKQPSVALIEQMPYAKAMLQEIFRLRPIIPIGVPHTAKTDGGTVMGYRIPKGAVVTPNIFRIHHDENIWQDPEKFDPTRHLDTDGAFRKSPNVIPFSIGARQCLGFQLANMELFLVLLALFRKFSFEFAGDPNIDMRGRNVFSLHPYPFQVRAKIR